MPDTDDSGAMCSSEPSAGRGLLGRWRVALGLRDGRSFAAFSVGRRLRLRRDGVDYRFGRAPIAIYLTAYSGAAPSNETGVGTPVPIVTGV